MGEMLIEAREAYVYGRITFSRICVFPEEEEEALKSLISLSSLLSLMTKC
jgi:hypothetical protein